MAKTEDDGGIGAEVSNRLDELFSEDDEQDANEENLAVLSNDELEEIPVKDKDPETDDYSVTEDESANGVAWEDDSPIDSLKALISAIEWEISDDTMDAFIIEVERLKEKHQDDPMLVMFLKLHESIGKYIRSKKARAHPDAIKFVTSVFMSFEKVITTPLMPNAQKKKLLFAEMKIFKEFKQRLMNRKQDAGNDSPDRVSTAKSERTLITPVKLENQEAIDYLVEHLVREMKKMIKGEFEKLRQEIGKSTS